MVTGVLTALAVLVGAVAQSLSGIGFVLVCGPLLVAALGPDDGVRLAVVLSLVVNSAMLARTWRDAELRTALLLLAPAALATPLAARLLRSAPDRLAEGLAGASAVVAAAALAIGLRWRAARGRAGAVLAGIVSAVMNVAAGIGGPAIALYAGNADWPATAMRSTAQIYFVGLNVVALVSLGFPHVAGALLAGCVAALAVGLPLGAVVAQRVSEPAARRLTLSLAGVGGLVVLLRSIVSG
ncbi:MAG: TSUP family transporter [Frankiaceae bacterium]|nr:TSUP family transporter [Frankiaceae bacterium]